MKNVTLIMLCAASLAGCGGSGGGNATSNAFEGTWAGTWGQTGSALPPPGDSGSLTLSVQADGTITGDLFNGGKAESASVTGSIANGNIHLDFDYPVSPDWSANGTLKITNGHLRGNILIDSIEYNRTVHTYYAALDLTHP